MQEGVGATDRCNVFCSDTEKVGRVKQRLKGLEVMVDIFKALSDKTRFHIVFALWHEELCVCDIAQVVGITVAGASYHLRYLRSLRLVKARKRGKTVFYQLDDDHVASMVRVALEHTREESG